MQVRLRNHDREVVVTGPRTVEQLLDQLEINPTTVLEHEEDARGGGPERGEVDPNACASCGIPTTRETCASCRQRARILAVLGDPASGGAAPSDRSAGEPTVTRR